eukprot:3488824-Rhodomonas_salina.2
MRAAPALSLSPAPTVTKRSPSLAGRRENSRRSRLVARGQVSNSASDDVLADVFQCAVGRLQSRIGKAILAKMGWVTVGGHRCAGERLDATREQGWRTRLE